MLNLQYFNTRKEFLIKIRDSGIFHVGLLYLESYVTVVNVSLLWVFLKMLSSQLHVIFIATLKWQNKWVPTKWKQVGEIRT